MKVKTTIGMALCFATCTAWASDPFIEPVPDDEITSEVRAEVETLRFRLRRVEETITDMEGFLIELQQRAPGSQASGEMPVLVGQSDEKEYYRLPDGSMYVWEKGSDAPRPRTSAMPRPPAPSPAEPSSES
jgi:hypothetical protein